MNILNKLKKFLFIIPILLLVSGCAKKPIEPGEVIELTAVELKEKIESGDTFLAFVGATWCQHCVDEYKPIIYDIAENNGATIYMCMADLNTAEDVAYLSEDYQLEYLPTTYVFKDKELKETKIGVTEKKEVIGLLKDYELLPK